jgi:ABC-type dipeptide/oligopeptide/nickel transport system permease subunit
MGLVLTAIVSPKVLVVMMVIILAGTGIMTKIVRSKYEYTPEREEELEKGNE